MQRGLPQAGAIVAQKYVISRLLGRGGMGAVYVVEHRFTGKRLALKCLLPEHADHPEFIERFLREAQAAGRIQHRNVVDVFDVGQDGDLVYIVMELLEGKALSDLLREGALTLEETLTITLRAMEGVAEAHKVGIVHRDLKPDNIFVCHGQSGQLDDPRVLDFGISKRDDDANKPLTKSGVMLGTPYYMAFEQINSQRDLDQRVDVYAMGVILYEAISGQPPYVAESVGALAIRMMSAPPVPLSQLRPELPEGLTDLVMRSIARDRDQRFPTMQALIDALRPFVSDSVSLLLPKGQGTPLGVSIRAAGAVDATLPAVVSSPPSQLKSSARLKLRMAEDHPERTPSIATSSRTLLWVGAGALLLILVGVTLVLALRDSEPTAAPIEAEAPPAAALPAKEPKVERKPRESAEREPPKAQAPEPQPAANEDEAAQPEPARIEPARPPEPPAQEAARGAKGKRKPVRGKETKTPANAAPAQHAGTAPEGPAASTSAPVAAPAAAEAPKSEPTATPPASVHEAPPAPAAEAPPADPKPEAPPAEPPPAEAPPQ